MKYLKQFLLILLFVFLGEILHALIPFPIPASIYGLVLLLTALMTGLIRLSDIEDTAKFLLEIMPLLFLPAIVKLITLGDALKRLLIPLLIAVFPVTCIVMGVTGKVTELCLKRKRRKKP